MSGAQDSALSQRYHDLFRVGTTLRSDTATTFFLTAEGTLDWQKLADLLPEDHIHHPDEFSKAVEDLAPAFLQCEQSLSSLAPEEIFEIFSKSGSLLQWSGKEEVLKESLHLLSSGDSVSCLLALLLLSSTLERALGDLFRTRGKNCPSMLKDLLTTEELRVILGPAVIQVLRIIIGPPMTMNLRNIAWHGFPSPGEIPPRFVWFLFLLYPSIGRILQGQGQERIPHKEAVEFSQTSLLNQAVPALSASDLSQVETTLEGLSTDKMEGKGSDGKKSFVPLTMVAVWSRALELFSEKSYGNCLVLLLPQLEHALRLVFARINACPERVCTAESTTLYTTFDEMLNPLLPSGEKNKLIDTLGERCLDLLHDLLVYPEGPRVRDRVSHGEADLSCVPEPLARSVLWAVLCCWHHCCPDSLGQLSLEWMETYESLFHPISMIKRKISEVLGSMSMLEHVLRFTPEQKTWHAQDGPGVFTAGNNEYTNILRQAMQLSFHLSIPTLSCTEISEVFLCPFHIEEEHSKDMLSMRIQTLYRNRAVQEGGHGEAREGVQEGELVGLCQQVAEECLTAATQMLETLRKRQQECQDKLLRTRQRDNFKRLLLSLPSLFVGINMIMVFLTWLLYKLDILSAADAQTRKKTQKFLKASLKITQNLQENVKVNKWTECVEKGIVDFLTKLDNYFKRAAAITE